MSSNGVPISIATAEVTDFGDGVVGSINIGGLSAENEAGKLAMKSFSLSGFDAKPVLELAVQGDADPEHAPLPIDLFKAFAIGGFQVQGVKFESADGTLVDIGDVTLGGIVYSRGVPVSAKLSVTDFLQRIPRELAEQQAADAMSLPVSIDIPTESLVNGETSYRFDPETGDLSFQTWSDDRKNELRANVNFKLAGLKAAFETIADGGEVDASHMAALALIETGVRIETYEPLPEPAMKGRQTGSSLGS